MTTDPSSWWDAIGAAVGLGALLGAVVTIFNSWKP